MHTKRGACLSRLREAVIAETLEPDVGNANVGSI